MTRQREKPLGLDMEFGEALERLIGVDTIELPVSVKLKKRGAPKRPLGIDDKIRPKPDFSEPD